MTSWSEQHGDEIYIYVRGQLVMKRWLRTGASVTFHVAPSGTHWSGRQGPLPYPGERDVAPPR